MSIEPEEIIKRQNKRIRRLASALRLIRSIVNGKIDEDAIDTLRLICEQALERKG